MRKPPPPDLAHVRHDAGEARTGDGRPDDIPSDGERLGSGGIELNRSFPDTAPVKADPDLAGYRFGLARLVEHRERRHFDSYRVHPPDVPVKRSTGELTDPPMVIDQTRLAGRQPGEREGVGVTGDPGRDERLRTDAASAQIQFHRSESAAHPGGRRGGAAPPPDPAVEIGNHRRRFNCIDADVQGGIGPNVPQLPCPPNRRAIKPDHNRIA